MLFRALALFSVLSLVFLATESQIQNPRHNKNCLVIKNLNGQYLTVNSRRQDRDRKLVLEEDFKQQRSTFRFEKQGQDQQGRTIYRIESCENNEAVSWALNERLKLKDFNYYAFANDLKRVNEFDRWVLDFQSDGTFVQILDAESNGRFNLFSGSTTDEKGNRLALVYARNWPRNSPLEENIKRFWTIDDAPDFKGSFERSFGRSKKPSLFGDKPSLFGDFENKPFDGKTGFGGKPFRGFDDSPVLDAEKEVDDHNTDEKPLVDENDDEDEEETTTTTTSTTTKKPDNEDNEDHEEEEENKEEDEDEEHKEEEEVLAAESKPKSKPRQPCYILKQRFRGLIYTLGLEKSQGGQRWTNVIMEQGSEKSSENAWRFVPESDRTFSSNYKIQNCKTDDILSVSYKQTSKSDNTDGEVFVVDENRISEEDAQLWIVEERKDNKILISDASKPSFYLSVTSNSNPKIRDVVSTKRDNTNLDNIVFTFEEFKN